MAYKTRNQAADVSLTATPPLARAQGKWIRWTRRMKAEFLDTLAATCNVRQAAAAIGVDGASVYALRRRDPDFLAEWALALDQGYQLIETLLVGHVLAGGGRCDPVGLPDGVAAIDVETGLRVLAQHRGGVSGGATAGVRKAQRYGAKPQRASDTETDEAILKKLAIIEKLRSRA